MKLAIHRRILSGAQQPIGDADTIEQALEVVRKMKPPSYHESIMASAVTKEMEPIHVSSNDIEQIETLVGESRMLTVIFCPEKEFPLFCATSTDSGIN